MNNKMKKIIALGLVSITIIGSSIAFSEPGSENDPLVSRSYVNNKIEELKSYVDNKIGSGSANIGGTSNSLEVVELKKGEYLIGGPGTEIILRGGKAKAHGVKVDAGITDTTAGKDIDSKTYLPYNHLLIIPRNDGRGAYAVEEAVFMVRGSYEIRK